VKVIGNLTKDAIIRALVSEGSSASETVGSEAVFETANSTHITPVYDSNENKTAIFYQDGGNSNYGTAIVATLSGTSLSYGSPVVFEAATTQQIGAAFDSNSNKVVVAYTDTGNSNHGTAIVGTISGTSISFGTPVVFNAATTEYSSVVFDSSNNKIVICYRDGGNSNYGTAIVGTVSGTSISFGSEAVFESATTAYVSAVFDSNSNKVVIGYQDVSNSDHGTAIVGTVSGTSISFGSAAVFESDSVSFIETSFDSTNNKIVIAYRDDGNSYYGTAIVGTVSGTSISFGSAVVYLSSQSNNYGNVHDSNAQKNIIYFRDQASSGKGTVIVGTVSGTSISFNTKTVINDASTEGNDTNIAFDSTGKKVIITFRDEGNSNYGTALAYQAAYDITTGGTIADGKPVVVNANGTVSSVSQTTASAGSLTALNSTNTGSSPVAVAFDSSNNKFVVAYADGFPNGVGKAQVGTVSGTSISFGSAATFEANEAKSISVTFDSTNNKIVIAFKDGNNSSYGTAVVGTVSGTSISFGTQVVFNSGNTTQIVGVHDTNAGKTVIAYRDDANSDQGTAIVGTVSGTSISFGSETIFNTGNTYYGSIAFDSDTNKVIIAYADYGNSIHGTAVVGTVSGTSISFGSEVVFAAASTAGYTGTAYDTNNNKVVIAFRDADNSGYGTAIVGTVSGTSISFGSEVVFAAHGTTRINCSYSSSNGKIIIFYGDGSSSNAIKVIEGTVSGTSISFGSAVEVTANNGEYLLSACDNNNHAVVSFNNNNNSVYATAAVFSSSASTLTTENFVGFMDGAALDGTNGEILSSCSISRNQTSLTPGQTYFVSPTDGSLSTSAGSPSVTAGTAISSTELIVKG